MAFQGDELAFYSLPLAERKAFEREGHRPIATTRVELYNAFVKSWLTGGIILVLLLGAASLDLPRLGGAGFKDIGRIGIAPLAVIGSLLYFFIGIWLVSHAHYQVLTVRWTISGTDVDPAVRTRWHRLIAVILIGVGVMAAFMPIGSTLALQRVVEALIMVALFIANLIVFLFILLLSIPFMLLRRTPPEALQNTPPPSFAPPLESAPLVNTTSSALMGIFFWGIMAVAIISVLLFYLRERGYAFDGMSLRGLWRAIVATMGDWWAWLRNRAAAVANALPTRRLRSALNESNRPRLPWRFVRVNSLPPREQIRFFYLAAVRRAREQGVARRPSETPLEYNADLVDAWPEVENDVEALTEAFLHARYSPQPVDADEAGLVKQTWQRLRRSLRQRNP
jgi:hypothetical protein